MVRLVRESSLSLHLGPDAWRPGDWRHTVAVCASSYLKCQWKERQRRSKSERNALARSREKKPVLFWSFSSGIIKRIICRKREREHWCCKAKRRNGVTTHSTKGQIITTAIYLSTYNYQREEKVSRGSVPIKLCARWLKLEIFIQMCVCALL